MKNTNHADPVNALAAQKQRDNRITACCDIFRGIVRANKTFLYAQIINYLLLAYSVWVSIYGAVVWAGTLVLGSFENKRY